MEDEKAPKQPTVATVASLIGDASTPPTPPLIIALRNIFLLLPPQQFEDEVLIERLRRESEDTQPTATATIDATTSVEQMQHANLGIQSHNFAHFEIIFENGEKQTHNLGKPMKLIFK
jgi:hypothetical protein